MIVIGNGGTGLQALEAIMPQVRQAGDQRPIIFVAADTDRSEFSSAELRLELSLTNEEVEEILACASTFGPSFVEAVDACQPLLHPAEQRSGARTCGMMTQIAFTYKLDKFRQVMSEAVERLMKRGDVGNICVFIIGSNGGGTSRALSILQPLALLDEEFRSRLLVGYHKHLLEPPVVVVASPYATARSVPDLHQDKILGNQYAWEPEMDEVLRRFGVLYTFTIGFSNAHGMALSTKQMMTRVLATSTIQLLRNYDYIKARLVDAVPNPALSLYSGGDLPEHRYESVRRLVEKHRHQETM